MVLFMNVKKIFFLASMFLIVCAAWTYADTYHYSDRIEIDGDPVMVSGSPWTTSQDANGNDLDNVGNIEADSFTNVTTDDIISDILHQTTSTGAVLEMNLNSESVLDSSTYNYHGTVYDASHTVSGGFNGGGAFELTLIQNCSMQHLKMQLHINTYQVMMVQINPYIHQ
jgi:type 1 fimbria pilin